MGGVLEPLGREDPPQVGRYRLVARLGAGGMGQVFLGFSPAGRPVAVKVVRPELARDKAFLARFRQEAAAARKVSGVYTAPVVDSGDGDRPWMATAFVAGPSLADAVEQQGPLPEISVWRLAAGLAEALAEVHSCGLIHRDLKPSNVLLAVDGPRVIDFGISRALDATALTGTGMVVGTPGFMSPEQATGTPVGPPSDVFSFGGVVTFAATGTGPFGDGNLAAMTYRVVHGEPALTELPGALTELVTRCLAKRPDDRGTLPELMAIITANLTPATSATAFWPDALTDFIGSYQAGFTVDTRALRSPAPGQAEPPPTYEPTARPRSADVHMPASRKTGVSREDPETVTGQRARTGAPPLPVPPADVPPSASLRPESVPPVSRPTRRPRRRGVRFAGIGAVAAAAAAVVVVLATSLSPSRSAAGGGINPQPPGGFGALPAESGTPRAGTVRIEEPPGANPTWILPIMNVANYAAYDVSAFDYEMWRPLYWPDIGVTATIDRTLSLANPPVWSNGDKTVTVTMNGRYRWSDGQPVSAQDVAFDIDLIKAALEENGNNWAYPSQGLNEVAGVSTLDDRTLVLNLTSAVNPSWFYGDVLAVLQPMPAHAWAKASASGPILDFTNPVNAKDIYDYLAAQSNARTTWAANPLWRVVDGPYRLASFNASTGADTMVASPSYAGPDSHDIKLVAEIPFTSDAAEFKALQTGRIDVGYIPTQDVPQVPKLKSDGYNVFGYPYFGWTFAVYNFKDGTGNFNHIVAQLYFRQAMAHLQDQQGNIRSFMYGAGSPAYGPIAPIPVSQYTPDDATVNPYPFSVAAARDLLARHGWTTIPNGTDSCERPGSGAGQCGVGIPKGTRLAFNLVYDDTTPLIRQRVTVLAAAAKQAGITINLQASTFYDITTRDNDVAQQANTGKWAMEDYGGYISGTYPTTEGIFNSQGSYNYGKYSDPQADKLIDASASSANPNAVKAEAAYLTAQQPALFQPNADDVYAWKETLSGPPGSFANLTQYYFTPEVWYLTT